MKNIKNEQLDEIFDLIIRLQQVNYLQSLIAAEMVLVKLKDYGNTPKNATDYLLWEQEKLLLQLEEKVNNIFASQTQK